MSMHVDSDVLLARIKADYPDAYELSLYRCLVSQLEHDNDRLHAENASLRQELDSRDRTAVGAASVPAYQPLGLNGGGGEHE